MVNVTEVQLGTKTRKSFGKIQEVMKVPNLIQIQKDSYKWFLETGLKEVLRDMEDVTDYSGNLVLSFVDYHMESKAKYSVKECKERQTSYSAPMRVTARLFNKETGEVKESEVYMGDFPLMTDSGTFVINGAERVIVSQLVRSPGVYYGMTHNQFGKKLFTTTVIPNRGAWLEYETDQNDIFYVRIDKNRKIPITTFIRSIGVFLEENGDSLRLSSDSDILEYFDYDERIQATLEKDNTKDSTEAILEVYKKLRPGEPPTRSSAVSHLQGLFFDDHRYDISRVGRYKYNKKLGIAGRIRGFRLAQDVVNEVTGEIIAEAGELVTKQRAQEIDQAGARTAFVEVEGLEKPVKVISNNTVDILPYLPGFTKEELLEIGINERVSYVALMNILDKVLDADKEEALSILAQNADVLIPKHITIDDILATINYLNCLANGVGNADDIDHLGNRRIRSVGELLQNQFRVGFARMERVVRERMGLQAQEPEKITPQALINTRPVIAAVREFFGSSPLSQFMDQNNPLAELTHKRRLSALGPGGLSRDRAGFEVRDVHYSHYGRMCPIETPEGPNIGLISYLATFARINEYGFIEAPFRPIDKETGVVLDTYEYMTADVEDEYTVVQANEPLDENGRFVRHKVNARHRDEFVEISPERADYMDVSPKMVVSVATALIPFLENDDANRALMGSNMQRQAVPLLTCERPFVGTGMEYKAATDSGVCVLAKNPGKVIYVSADKVDVLEDDNTIETYNFIKFMRSNQGTCINQKPVVEVGQRVEKGQVIADGAATDNGELSLGKNALIGFMTWEGYNYEDAVLINERLVREDVYTSIHIERYDLEARDTKLGAEEITNEIPNVGDDARKDLDERGIIRIGAEVKSGDILVGKVTPKGETEMTPEERLLRAIFGEKAREVRDTSLRVPHGEYGIVVKVEVFTRENSDELAPGVNKVVRCYIAQKRKIQVGDKMAGRHGNKGVVSRVLPQEDMPFLEDGTPLDIVLNPLGVPSRMNIGQVLEVHLGFACRELGWHIMTPVFDGAHEDDIRAALEEAGLQTNGKVRLTDGRTGEKFDEEVTVGVMYYLKLHHLVDDTMHARSIGPYSLVTQQPLGGKAQFGGQRFGEM
ncbi:MAG: DNA-directed RNA polymerase subunit beta, partial [Acutalibacteraceae bacterium]